MLAVTFHIRRSGVETTVVPAATATTATTVVVAAAAAATAFADTTAITVTVAGDGIAHAQPATASDGRAWPAGVVEENRCWVWVVAVEGGVNGTCRAGLQHQLRLCGRRKPDR
jgi:hypothetical protein